MASFFAVFNVVLYFSYAYSGLWAIGISPLKPLHWYLGTIVLGSVMILMNARTWLSGGRHLHLVAWAAAFMFVSGLSCLFSGAGPESLQALISLAEALLLLIVFVFVFHSGSAFRSATYAVACVVVTSVLINHAEFFSRGTLGLSNVTDRAAGLYENPNLAGVFLVLGMVLSVWILPKRIRWVYCLFVATGVVVTFSRSAMILWALAVLAMAWRNWFALPRALSVLSIGAFLVVLGVALAAGEWIGFFKSHGMDAYLTKNTSARIGGAFFGQRDDSSLGRAQVAQRGAELFLDAPLLGHGLGATRGGEFAVFTHNQYLRIGAEQGIVGLLLYSGLIWIMWRAGSDVARITAILYAVSGLFSHNNLDIPAMQIVLALAVSGSGGHYAGDLERRAPGVLAGNPTR